MDVDPQPGLLAWVEYLRDLGIYDLYRRESPSTVLPPEAAKRLLQRVVSIQPGGVQPGGATLQSPQRSAPSLPRSTPRDRVGEQPERVGKGPSVVASPLLAKPAKAVPSAPEPVKTYFGAEAEGVPELPPELAAPMPKPNPLEGQLPAPAPLPPAERAAALERLQAEIGDCTRCPLAYAGRHTIVFGEGDPNAALLFVGEGPGADEDTSGRPFVGKAGQLLNNMIGAMGLQREQVYIANVVKCRPPGNRTPEFAEASTCSQFLLGQIDIVRPKVIVALGATAATYLLGVRQPLASLRGQWLRCREAKVAVTFHPAFLLRDPRQKAEAWKDLQRVMAELGLKTASRNG